MNAQKFHSVSYKIQVEVLIVVQSCSYDNVPNKIRNIFASHVSGPCPSRASDTAW